MLYRLATSHLSIDLVLYIVESLQSLGQLVLPTLPYGFEKEKLIDINNKIGAQIINYVSQHSQDFPNEGLVDLSSYHHYAVFQLEILPENCQVPAR